MKKRPHRDPALAMRILSLARARQSTAPLPRKSFQTLSIRHHGSLTNVTQGKATWDDLNELCNTLNIALKLAQGGAGDTEDLAAIGRAGEAIRAMEARRSATGRVVAAGAELAALQQALEIHDAQLQADGMTEGLYLAAIDSVRAAIRQGDTVGAAA